MIILNLLQKHGMVTSGDEICLWGNWGTRLIIDSQGNVKRDWWDKHLNGYNKGNVDTPASWLKPVEDIKISLKDFTLTILESEKDKKVDLLSMLAERENRDCEKCGKLTEVWFRRKGGRAPFLKCINCGNLQDFKKRSGGDNFGYEKKDLNGRSKMTAAIKEEIRYCPKHEEKVQLVLKRSRYGPFYSCSKWKRDKSGCNYTEKI